MIANAERAALAILRDAGLKAHVTPPRGIVEPYIRVGRVGGTMANIVTDAAIIAVSAYAEDAAAASDMANEARAALWRARTRWAGGVWVRWWKEIGGPAHYPDPDSRLVRYQFNGQLFVKAPLDVPPTSDE